MIEKTTTNRNYPKPDTKNFLQDDVTRLENALDAIDQDIHAIDTGKADQTALQSAIDTINTAKADVDEIKDSLDTVDAELHGMKQEMPLLAGTHPFLFCKMRRSGRGATYLVNAWTTEMGTLNNNADVAPMMFKQFIGGNNNNYDIYSIPPMLQFVGPDARWVKSDSWLEHAYHENQYKYGAYEMILMFFKNTGESDLTRTFSRIYSATGSNGDYGRSSAYVGTPDQTDANSAAISSIAWTVAHFDDTNGSGKTALFDITVPAGKTVALLFYSSAGMDGSSSTYHFLNTDIGIYDFGNFLCDGLEVDHKRTLKAMQYKTQEIHEIWR